MTALVRPLSLQASQEKRVQEPVIAEMCELAASLKPREFRARIDMWRRGGLPGGVSEEMVKRSRSASMPALDRMDRELQLANRTYAANLDDIRRLLAANVGLELKYLFKIEVASKQLAEMVSDDPQCIVCGMPAKRLKAGRCSTDYNWWTAHDREKDRPKEMWAP